jgi:radical SAM superfamily enzyme YgiQ (UPF0313 family)
MKLLLIQPPIQDFYDTDIRLQPLGLCMLKAVVRKHVPDVEVIVKDYHQGCGRKTIPVPAELSYLEEYYALADSSPFSTFHQYYHFGASFEAVAKDVLKEKPDLVGISSLFTPYHREAVDCAKEIKKRSPVPILMGGSHVSAFPMSILKDTAVDFTIRGEGERPLVEFVRALLAGMPLDHVPNLGYKINGEPVLNATGEPYPFHELPFADFSDLPKERYLYQGKPLCFITTTRGCPHGCSFCSVHATFGKQFQARSPENILQEIGQRHGEGYRVFDFEDDNLSFHGKDFKRLLKLISAEFNGDGLHLLAMNGISHQSLDGEILQLMRLAGFGHLNIALVSSSEGVLKRLHRPHTLASFLEVVTRAHALGFKITSYQILGLPYETLDDMIQTLTLLARLPVLIGISVFYLAPGCSLAKEFPELTETDLFKARSTAMATETEDFARDHIHTLFITARIMNFLKGIQVDGEKLSLREALDIAGHQGGRQKLGAEILTRLFEERTLYAATRQGFKPVHRFRPELFFLACRKTGYVVSQHGGCIELQVETFY